MSSPSGIEHVMRKEFPEGKHTDLREAIEAWIRTNELVPNGHSDKAMLVSNFGRSSRARFDLFGDTDDLEKAVILLNRYGAVDLLPEDEKPAYLFTVGTALAQRSIESGNLEDLERAVTLHCQAVELIANGHPERALYLNNAGLSLQERFLRLGNLEDIARAIALLSDAIELTPDGHPDKPARLSNYASSLQYRYERTGDPKDLEHSISLQASALELTPDDDPEKRTHLISLGNKLHARFEQSGSLDDLDNAITYLTNAEKLVPEEHADRPSRLHNLSRSLAARFKKGGNVADIDEAVRCGVRAAELLPRDHSQRAQALRSLGLQLLTRLYSPHAHPDDLVRASEAYREAMYHEPSQPLQRLLASLKYADLLADFSPLIFKFTVGPRLSPRKAYEYALSLVPQCIWLGNDVRGRYTSNELREVGRAVNEAITAAIAAGDYKRTLEWLEIGRAIVWSQISRLKTPLDNLQRLHPQLAHDLHHVSQALQHATGSPSTQLSLDTQARSSHGYALDYDRLIKQIRQLEGFENFLRPRAYSELIRACAVGPIVIINIHSAKCDALILHQPGRVKHVPLSSFSEVHAKKLHKDLWSILNLRRLRSRFDDSDVMQDDEDDRGGNLPGKGAKHDPMYKILADLWNLVVKPILDVVCTLSAADSVGRLPHITWCPTGPLAFLPLHAAGIYQRHGASESVMDYAVSSYTPTLEALLKPRLQTASIASNPRVLIVSQPATPGCHPIPGTTIEAGIVTSHLERSAVDVLEDEDGTVNAVLEGMATHEWVHLACHGVQNREDPTNSAFALYDGRLTLNTLMSQSLPNAELAVLSACQTATGDENLSEEAVHLAAGMLNVGYKSVIGTMWSISDSSAPIVMGEFYRVMAEQVRTGGELQPVYALHEATKALRSKYGATDFVRWIPFVHFGL